jgi:hypothetical protein
MSVLILAIQVLFVLVVIFNIILNVSLGAKYKQIAKLSSDMTAKSRVVTDVRNVNDKIILYRSVTGSRESYSDKLDSVLIPVRETSELVSLNVESKNAKLSVRADRPLQAGLLIAKILDNESVSEIILTSAELRSRDQAYIVGFEVVFK